MVLVFRVLIVISINYLLTLYLRIINPWFWAREERNYALLHLEITFKSLNIDYQLLERPETQDTIEKTSRNIYSWGSIQGLVNRGFTIIEGSITFIIACSIILSMNIWLIFIICSIAIFKMIIGNKNRKKEKTEFNDKTPPFWRKITYTNNISTNPDIGKDMRIYKMDKFISQERDKATYELLQLQKKNRTRNFLFQTIISILSFLDSAFLYGFLIYEVIYNEMEISMFSFMLSAVTTMVSALSRVITDYSYMMQNSLETDDFKKLMIMDEVNDNEKIKIDELEEIEFRNVYYSYYMQEGYALENISFKLRKGEKVALVGFNGAGKTTIVKLMTGLYHPVKGNIYLNGININDISSQSLVKLISPVYQENIIYSLSIAENIAMMYGPKIDYDKIDSVLKAVELTEKIETLEHKEKTMLTRDIDEKGINLSGGESQKLSIARAIYKDAFLYILDEPTSALDAFSEYSLYNKINEMVRGNTTLYISHRLSSTRFCDRIIFLSQGKIIEEGTHEQLMDYEGEYKKLFTVQADYYVKGDNNE